MSIKERVLFRERERERFRLLGPRKGTKEEKREDESGEFFIRGVEDSRLGDFEEESNLSHLRNMLSHVALFMPLDPLMPT